MKQLFLLLMLVVVSLLSGCGSESNTGLGSTVYIKAGLQDGKSGAVFGSYSSGVLVANDMFFSVRSYKYDGGTAVNIPTSDVYINSVRFVFAPINTPSCIAPVLTNNIWQHQLAYAARVPAGGELKIDNVPIFTAFDAPDFAGVPFGSVCTYDVTAIFSGTEVNTGITLTDQFTFTSTIFKNL